MAANWMVAELKVQLAKTESELSRCRLAEPLAKQQPRQELADGSARGREAPSAQEARWNPTGVSPAAGQPRTLLQAGGDDARPCSKAEVDAVPGME